MEEKYAALIDQTGLRKGLSVNKICHLSFFITKSELRKAKTVTTSARKIQQKLKKNKQISSFLFQYTIILSDWRNLVVELRRFVTLSLSVEVDIINETTLSRLLTVLCNFFSISTATIDYSSKPNNISSWKASTLLCRRYFFRPRATKSLKCCWSINGFSQFHWGLKRKGINVISLCLWGKFLKTDSSYEEDLRRLMCFLDLLQVARSDYGRCARSTRVKQKCDSLCKTHANISRPSSAIIWTLIMALHRHIYTARFVTGTG